MKTVIQIIFCFLLFSNAVALAQASGQIDGKILVGSASEPVVIQLLSAQSNALIKTQLSEPGGSFKFAALAIGNYIVFIDDSRFASYKSEIIAVTVAQPTITLAEITLLTNTVNKLDEVVVKNKKPIVENKIDKTIVNVDAMITAAGVDAMDVLEKSPGIIVDQNGTITFKGKSGVSVFIDDKPTYLSGTELESYLKSLPAGTLSQIELMTNPPAKFDAAGSAGVINIITKKSKAKGFNGSVSSRTRQGIKTNLQETLNLNYVNDKIRLFGNAGYGLQQPVNDLFIFRHFKNEDLTTKSYFDQNSDLRSVNNTGNAKIGVDYYVSERTTFGASVSGTVRSGRGTSDVNSVLRDAYFLIDSTIVANNSTNNRFTNIGLNLNFRHDIDKQKKITADADYLNYTNKTDQLFRNFVYQPDNSLTSQDESVGILPSAINIFSVKTDYTQTFKNEATIEAGYKISVSKTDNIADYSDVIGAVNVPNYDMSNHFRYDEVINAAYVNFNTSYRRFTFQAGLRVENTDSRGNQMGNVIKPASKFLNNYTNLFPTLYVQYKLDSIGDNQLVASYGKRITRPYYEDLNPFISPLDKFTFYAGNPYLNPSFSHSYELSYRYKSLLSVELTYDYDKDNIDETIEIDDDIYYSRPGNIGKSHVYSLSVNAQIPVRKWFTSTIYTEVTHSEYQSKLYTEDLNSAGTYWYISVMNQFSFAKNWSAECSGLYMTKVVSSQFELGARGNINIGIQKKILQGQGSVKLSGNDIFQGNIYHGTINNLRLTDATWTNKPDTRSVVMTFSYSFGKVFQSREQYETSGADAEKNRVKS